MLLKASNIFPDVACFSAQPASSRSLQDARNWSPINRKGFSRSIMKCTYQQPGSLTCSASNKGSFRWAKDATCPSMTSKHILPDDKRPMLADVSRCCIPVIDMDAPSNVVIQSIASACEEYGFFHVINHKIPQELCQSMLGAVLDLFHLPPELFYSDDLNRDVRICHHFRKHQTSAEKIPMWSEVFKHSWHPHDDFTQALPTNPPQYREAIHLYAKHVGNLMTSLMGFMSQGLGLGADCLTSKIGENPTYRVQANYYPPCPSPELTLGLGVHTDRDALTVILPTPEVQGLQVMKDDKWIMVDPTPGALVVNLGDQLQVLSNGKYKSVLHRAITNNTKSRVSLAMFYGPSKDTIIGPIEDLVDENHPRKYRSYRFSEFIDEFRRQAGNNRIIKEAFEVSG